jgi:hypothetical protein
MNEELIDRIAVFLDMHPEVRGIPASAEEIYLAETELAVEFNQAYKTFLYKFGGA